MTNEDYKNKIKRHVKSSPLGKNCSFSFLIGGGICAVGEVARQLFLLGGVEEKVAPMLVSVGLIFLAAILTGIGVFDNIARVAGAGTLVPVTGFANAVVSPAIDTKSEGLVVGVGSKIFTVAGPVILFATLSGVAYGCILAIVRMF